MNEQKNTAEAFKIRMRIVADLVCRAASRGELEVGHHSIQGAYRALEKLHQELSNMALSRSY